MKVLELKEILAQGIKPIICFNEKIEELELQFDEGMFAEVLNVVINEIEKEAEIVVSEKNFAEKNKAMEKAQWKDHFSGDYDKKYSELYERTTTETFYDGLDELTYFSVKEDNLELLNEWKNSKSEKSYVLWLEEKCLEIRKANEK